jgi:hypothetical protein
VSPVRYEQGFYIPEDDILHSHSRENLKSHMISLRPLKTLESWVRILLEPRIFIRVNSVSVAPWMLPPAMSVIAQANSLLAPTVMVQIRVQVKSREICGQKGTEAGLVPLLCFPLPILIQSTYKAYICNKDEARGFPQNLKMQLQNYTETQILCQATFADFIPRWPGFEIGSSHVRFEVFTAVTMRNVVLWDVTPCGSCKNRRFGGT